MRQAGATGPARALTLAVAFAGIVATVLITALPFVHFAYRSKPLHVAIETAATLIAMLVALLVYGRFRRSAALSDLLLTAALLFVAFVNFAFSLLPTLSQSAPSDFEIWSPLAGRLIGAGALAAAALAPEREVARARRHGLTPIAGCAIGLVAAAALGGVLSLLLSSGIDPSLSPEASGRPRLVGHGALLALQIVAMLLYAVAAFGFLRRAERTGDELMLWFAAGSTLGAFARLNYFLFPSIYTEWVYTGDFLRIGFYLLLLIGAAREIGAYQRQLAHAAVLDERRRIARELHDGLAQDLASVIRNLAMVDDENNFAARARASAARALAGSRRAISALTNRPPEPLDRTLAETAREVAEREGTRVVLALTSDVVLRPQEAEALLMITSEAITNAARHSGADVVRLELSGGERVRLRVSDAGRGFDPADVSTNGTTGFGLVGMRERAEAIGAKIHIGSRPGHGTELEVVL